MNVLELLVLVVEVAFQRNSTHELLLDVMTRDEMNKNERKTNFKTMFRYIFCLDLLQFFKAKVLRHFIWVFK